MNDDIRAALAGLFFGPGKPAGRSLVIALLLFLGCGGHDASGSRADLRVSECDNYGRKAAACFHREELASVVATVAHTEAERDRMRTQCLHSLELLNTACR